VLLLVLPSVYVATLGLAPNVPVNGAVFPDAAHRLRVMVCVEVLPTFTWVADTDIMSPPCGQGWTLQVPPAVKLLPFTVAVILNGAVLACWSFTTSNGDLQEDKSARAAMPAIRTRFMAGLSVKGEGVSVIFIISLKIIPLFRKKNKGDYPEKIAF
jgi:hypothetical protein